MMARLQYSQIPEDDEEEAVEREERAVTLRQSGRTAVRFLSALALASLVAGMVLAMQNSGSLKASHTQTAALQEAPAAEEQEALGIVATNAYTVATEGRMERNVYAMYPHLEGRQVVEPYVVTTIVATGTDDDGIAYRWMVDGVPVKGDGARMEYTFERPVRAEKTVYTVELQEEATRPDGSTVMRTVKEDVEAVYVRRELRDLLPQDQEDFMDAFHYIMTTPEDVAQAEYGPDFVSMATLHILHNDYAGGDMECDHLHNGPSFLPAHEAITVIFEKDLQMIHPRLAAPYWDYFIEANEIETSRAPWSTFYESEILGSKWFGSTDPDDGSIKGSRFDKLEIYTATDYEGRVFHGQNGFGQARARWNHNPSKYVTRFRTRCGTDTLEWLDYSEDFEGMATCANLRTLFERDSFHSFLSDLALDVHGSIHIAMGGISGPCDGWDSELRGFTSSLFSAIICAGASVNLKDLWRKEVVTYADTCEDASCGITCDTDAMSLEEIGAAMSSHARYSFGDHGGFTSDQLTRIGNMVCNSGMAIGDMYSSSATADPLFWVIHTLSDRMVHYRFLDDLANGRDLLDTTLVTNTRDVDCSYQLPEAEVPFDLSYVLGGDSYSNQDLLDAFVPTNEGYVGDYIYDDFNFGGQGSTCLKDQS